MRRSHCARTGSNSYGGRMPSWGFGHRMEHLIESARPSRTSSRKTTFHRCRFMEGSDSSICTASRNRHIAPSSCFITWGTSGFLSMGCTIRSTELLHDRSSVHLTMVQLPALNTPQFEWTRSRMPRRAQPVPPIFQPEVAAEAIVWAATHRRRELDVGWPTVKAILGDRVAAGWQLWANTHRWQTLAGLAGIAAILFGLRSIRSA